MSIIKKFLNLLRFAANFDRFVETVRVDNSGNVFIRFKRNVHINTAGHMMLTSRKGHIIVKGEHFHMQPSIPDLYAHATGFTQSEKVIESLQAETRIRLKKLYGKDAKIEYENEIINDKAYGENKKLKIEKSFYKVTAIGEIFIKACTNL